MRKPMGVLFSMILAATTVAVFADTKIEYKATENGGSSLTTILIGQGKIRSDADANTTAIIDPTEGSMTMIDRGKKQFTKITRADLQQMLKMMSDLEQQMANMPPEVKQMMASRMPAGAADPSVTVDTGEKATVAGKSCRIFRTTKGGRTTAESCMAEASSIDIAAADRATMTAAMAWSKELTDAMAKAPMMASMADATPFRAGLVPLRTTTIDASGGRKTSELVGVSTAALPADTFAIPAGFKEQKLPTMGRGRGGN